MKDRMTQEELRSTLIERFGSDPMKWAFVCPSCGDIATGQDFRDALTQHPRGNETASSFLGRECIGRTLGALVPLRGKWKGRGCDWAAYGLFKGPVIVTDDEGREIGSFRIAPAPVN